MSDFVDDLKKEDKKKKKPKPGEFNAAVVKDALEKTGKNILKFTPHTPLPQRRDYRERLYSEEVADIIVKRLVEGETMAAICSTDDMPSVSNVWRWQKAHPEFKERMEDAKRNGSHYIADDCIRISDDPTIDPMHKRIMVDTRLRLIKCWHRQAYGDNIQVSGDQQNPVRFFIDGLSDREMK